MVNETSFSTRVESFNQSFFCFNLDFESTSFRVSFVENISSATTSIDSAKNPIPSHKCIITRKLSKINTVNVLVESFIIVIVLRILFDLLLTLRFVLNSSFNLLRILSTFSWSRNRIRIFLHKFSHFGKFLPHGFCNGSFPNDIKLQHGLFNGNRFFGSKPQPRKLIIPNRNKRWKPTCSPILRSRYCKPMPCQNPVRTCQRNYLFFQLFILILFLLSLFYFLDECLFCLNHLSLNLIILSSFHFFIFLRNFYLS